MQCNIQKSSEVNQTHWNKQRWFVTTFLYGNNDGNVFKCTLQFLSWSIEKRYLNILNWKWKFGSLCTEKSSFTREHEKAFSSDEWIFTRHTLIRQTNKIYVGMGVVYCV